MREVTQEIELVCPACRGRVVASEQAINCPTCCRSWPVQHGVPLFAENALYWGELEQARMRELNETARQIGWNQAVDRFAAHLRDYITSEHRVDWIPLVGLSPSWRVLDMGAGWGGNAFPLCRHVEQVVAVESVPERTEFLSIRKEQEEARNLQVICASVHSLPLPENSFDLIILNGFLEWAAISKQGQPREIQKEVLAGIRRLLRDQGCVYIGIENRFGINMLLGGNDHSNMKYTSLMPRFMASLAMRLGSSTRHFHVQAIAPSYRTYTYSYWGYLKLLHEAGYHSIEVRGALTYNMPTVMYCLDHAHGFRHYLRDTTPRSAKGRVLRLIGLKASFPAFLKLLSPCFCIAAR